MRKNIKQFTLTEKNIDSIKPEDIVAITLASGGAMGDPGAIEIVNINLKVYYTHLGEIEIQKLKKIIPFIDAIQLGIDEVEGLSGNWTSLYTGFGNFLIIRPELKGPILDYINKNYSDTECSKTVELYTHWYDALDNYINWTRHHWDDFFEKLTADMPQEYKEFVKTKKGRKKFMDWYFESDHDEYPWAFFTKENME